MLWARNGHDWGTPGQTQKARALPTYQRSQPTSSAANCYNRGPYFARARGLTFRCSVGVEAREPVISVFISHSSVDEGVAAALADLLQQALAIRSEDIRCSSVDGYRLPPGVNFKDILRSEVAGARAFIGLVTPASRSSEYVLFEMGARWGAGLTVVPLMACGSSTRDLPKPLTEVIAVDASQSGQLSQLVETIGKQLGHPLQPPSQYHRQLQRLVDLSSIHQATGVHDSLAERLRELCQAAASRPTTYDIWVTPELGGRRLQNLRERLGLTPDDTVIAWIENSHNGTDGLAVLVSGICWRNTYRDKPERLGRGPLRQLSISSPTRKSVSLGGRFEIDLRGGDAEGPVVAELLRDLVRATA